VITLEAWLDRVWEQIGARAIGPLSFRWILQPAVAAAVAFRAGLRDAREQRPPFLWTVLTDPGSRLTLLRTGWRDVGMVFVAAILMDGVYQVAVLGSFHLAQAGG
jgi:hypothetical protein